MKIEHCRYFGQDGVSLRRMILVIDETQLVSSGEYKTELYNVVFDALCDVQDLLLEESSLMKKMESDESPEGLS